MAGIRQQMRQDMYNCMRELLGTGYVKSYYIECMADFVQIADWYAEEKAKAELQEKLRRQREACLKAVDELPEYDHGCPADHMEAIMNAEIDNNGEEG